jgi:DNA-binding XRE family transcriptional regulator
MDVKLVNKRDVWTPAIDYNKLQKQVLLALSCKPLALTGNEIRFIRTYFEMTLEAFGSHFGVTHVAVLKWEKTGDKVAKISPTTELCVRLFILEKLNSSNQLFREVFREFDIKEIIKPPSSQSQRLVTLPGSQVARRIYA